MGRFPLPDCSRRKSCTSVPATAFPADKSRGNDRHTSHPADKPASGLIDDKGREQRFAVVRRRRSLAAEVDRAAADISRAQFHAHADAVARIGRYAQADLRRIRPILFAGFSSFAISAF